jgi:glycyl-tRNA synthetase
MKSLYDKNGLIFFSEEEIMIRETMVQRIVLALRNSLFKLNTAFHFHRCEAPCLMPKEQVNPNYTDEDVFTTHDGLVLRPETTLGSYLYAREILNPHNAMRVYPPMVVWQHGRSFRREQDQVLKNMRLKEFHQLEFQIIYSHTTKADYAPTTIVDIRAALEEFIGPCYVEDSDRLPSYSEWTKDIISSRNNMEVCSISSRNDLEGYKVLEVAIGTDRMVYNNRLRFDQDETHYLLSSEANKERLKESMEQLKRGETVAKDDLLG